MAFPADRTRRHPLTALLLALGLLALINGALGPWAPARDPDPRPYRTPRPSPWLARVHPHYVVTGSGLVTLRTRPGDPYRILMLGSSALFGSGVTPFQSIPGRLQRLMDIQGLPVEVINAGVIGSDSTRQRTVLTRCLDLFSPDLVVFYGGNNEFLRLRAYKELDPRWSPRLERVHATLEAAPLYRVLAAWLQRPYSVAPLAGVPVDSLPSRITREDVPMVRELFERNLRWIASTCAQKGIPVFLCAAVGNQMTPPEDEFPDAEVALRTALLRSARHGRLREFLLEEAGRRPTEAWLQHACGRLLLKAGDTTGAARHLMAAVETDSGPCRALPSFTPTVRDAAREAGARFVDLPALLRQRYGPVLGDQVFLDHCHFLPQANEQIAGILLARMRAENLLPAAVRTEPPAPPDLLDLESFPGVWETHSRHAGANRLARFLPHELVVRFHLDRRPPAPPGSWDEWCRRLPPATTLEGQTLRGHLAFLDDQPARAVTHYRQAVRMAPGRAVGWRNLGHALAKAGQVPQALDAWSTFLARGGRDPRLERLLGTPDLRRAEDPRPSSGRPSTPLEGPAPIRR